jgi:hypothetical protein
MLVIPYFSQELHSIARRQMRRPDANSTTEQNKKLYPDKITGKASLHPEYRKKSCIIRSFSRIEAAIKN